MHLTQSVNDYFGKLVSDKAMASHYNPIAMLGESVETAGDVLLASMHFGQQM